MKINYLRRYSFLHTICLIVLALLFVGCARHTPPDLSDEERIDELIDQLSLKEMPGCAITVIRQDSIVYSKGAGLSNIETEAANTPTTIFNIGSISKSFTAACIIKLVIDNKLDLNTRIKDFFPSFNEALGEATIEQLLHHTSGLRDNESVGQLIESAGTDSNTGFFVGGDEDHMHLIEMQNSLNYEHGSQYTYNNTGYWLLGQIVEKVSGEPLENFSKKHIFSPLGMNSTSFGRSNVKNLSSGHHTFSENQKPKVIDISSKAIGDGGVYTTSLDLAKWTNEMWRQEIFGANFWELMLRKGVLNNTEDVNYGGGILIKEEYGNKMYSHGGLIPGYYSMFQVYPDHKTSIVVLANHTLLDAGRIARQIADILIPKDEFKIIDLPINELKKYEGQYYSADLGWFRELRMINDTLYYTKPKEKSKEKFPILPIGNDEFTSGGFSIYRFSFLPDNRKRLTLINPGFGDRILDEIPNDNPSEEKASSNERSINFEKYIGEYRSEEFGLTWKIYTEHDKLNIDVNSFESELEFIKDNMFTAEGRFNIHFIEDKTKTQFNEFLLDFGKAKNIKFSKIKF